ncbi:imelysin family protein [Dyadobacter sp. CY356]|uniref:imelysin family protein n=1 Tax=Dyadobacter sp. CY356 TaxID=2906442 RepID=UPI001F344648|nr:imelysin family protein [Dyadobacter sp. CY356]MCF0055024.1 imelysin family protein [Dyadobacter sp. CY356]
MKYFLCFSLLISLACSREKQPEPTAVSDRQFAVQGIGNAVIIRSFLDLQNSVNTLNEFATSYVYDSTNTEKLYTLRREWTNTVISWKLSSIFLKGKLSEDIKSAAFYPAANITAIEKVISSDTSKIDLAYVQALPENATGLAAIEYLIYGTNQGDDESVISAFNATGSRRGSFLRALCQDLKQQSDQLMYHWSIAGDAYINKFMASGGNARSESLGVLTDNIISTISIIKDERVGLPLGINQGKSQPELVESKYGGQSINFIRAELQGIEQIFSGKRTNKVGINALYWLLDQDNAKSGDVKLSSIIEAQFADIFSKLDLIKSPLEQAVVSNPKQVADFYESLSKLQLLVQNDMVTSLKFQD